MSAHLLFLLLFTKAAAQDAGAGVVGKELNGEPVNITGDAFSIQGRESTATYKGHVNVVMASRDAHLSCDELVAHYTSAQTVSRIECLGGAEATQGDKWAKGDRADFDNASGVIVVSGNPQARQAASHVEGEQFTIDLLNDTLHGTKVKTLAQPSTQSRGPVQIFGDVFDVQGKRNIAAWSGHVRVRKATTLLSCDRLLAKYGEDQQIREAECLGHALAEDGDKWAKGDKAIYDVPRGFITVTGAPQAQQGPNHMTADKVFVDLPADRISAEGHIQTTFQPNTVKLPTGPKDGGR